MIVGEFRWEWAPVRHNAGPRESELQPLHQQANKNEAAGAADAARAIILKRCTATGTLFPPLRKRSRQANNWRRNVHSNPIASRVRRKRQRLPSSLLIETVSPRSPRLRPSLPAPGRFRSRLATIRPSAFSSCAAESAADGSVLTPLTVFCNRAKCRYHPTIGRRATA